MVDFRSLVRQSRQGHAQCAAKSQGASIWSTHMCSSRELADRGRFAHPAVSPEMVTQAINKGNALVDVFFIEPSGALVPHQPKRRHAGGRI